ncbi:glycerate kinase [Niallia endozanthoxylica]|uniref:Glycerate kinase n=1 Tax=Niallia endozanthoxylica TaxID=2036016 RepID=A0A5J5I3N2_9BACI|nr:glycerate kinase [Niallia endozanthoxylica]KAA9030638.1 glycerate kinase [Niallia endozanthoxylica]
MKVLIAIDSFKGSISSLEGSKAIALGIKEVYPAAEIVTLPLADGGEGTVEALVRATGGRLVKKEVTGPLQEKIQAAYGILGDQKTAVIEVAEACGLPLVPLEKRNPFYTTTYGVGELILDAMDHGCREFVIGLGGSATNDAGVGMLQALGYRFLDNMQETVGLGAKELSRIVTIDVSQVTPLLKQCYFRVACDVNNPLYGPDGASHIFGPQKGATPEMVEELDLWVKQLAEITLKELNVDIQSIAGAGAAGGLGAAFSGFLGAHLESGINLILDMVQMEKHLEGADFVITGEGKIDGQTSRGKAPLGAAKLAQNHQIPVIALAGSVTDETNALHSLGMTSIFSIISSPLSLEKAMDPKVTFNQLQMTVNQIFRLIQVLKG